MSMMLVAWIVAFAAVGGVVAYRLINGFLDWRSSSAVVRADADAAVEAIEQYRTAHGHYPADLTLIGIPRDPLYWESDKYYLFGESRGYYIRYTTKDGRDAYALSISRQFYGWYYDAGAQTWSREDPSGGG